MLNRSDQIQEQVGDPQLLISIGITCYREGEWLQECWESVLAQTDPRWEAVMILDGGADDETRKIFNQISHPKLRKIMLQKNVGPYLCRTLTILNAKTEWYAQLDGDDLLPEEAVKLIIYAIRDNPAAKFVFGDAIHFSKKHEEIKKFITFSPDDLTDGMNITGTSPIKKELFVQMNGFTPELLNGGADWDFWVGVAEQNTTGCRADGIIYKRRRREGSVGYKRRLERDKVAEFVISRHPSFFSIQNRKNRSLGKAYELIARDYRLLKKRKKAAIYANKAIALGYETETLREILKERDMNIFRYFIRVLSKKRLISRILNRLK